MVLQISETIWSIIFKSCKFSAPVLSFSNTDPESSRFRFLLLKCYVYISLFTKKTW